MTGSLLLLVLCADVPALGDAQATKALTVKQKSGSGGTMHFATRTELSVDGGSSAVMPWRTSPIVHFVIALEGGAWLLLGYSSGGSGYQSEDFHVISDKLQPVAELSRFNPRSARCVLVRRDAGGWSLGILPNTSEESGLTVAGKKVAPIFTLFTMTDTTWAFCPPFQEALRPPKQVAWVRVGAAGFQPEGSKDNDGGR